MQTIERWYQTWRGRIHAWVQGRSHPVLADLLLLTPYLLMLFVGLIGDRRVSRWTKLKLVLATAYVLSPFDFLPEMLLGVVGLTDDAGLMMSLVYGMRNVVGVEDQIILDHWHGNNDLIRTMRDISARIEKLMPWRRLRRGLTTGIIGKLRPRKDKA